MPPRGPVIRLVGRSLATVLVIAGSVILLLMLLSGVVNREIVWTASPQRGALAPLAPMRFADSTAMFAAVDAYVADEMRAVRAPGLVIAIVHDRRIVHQRALGYADTKSRRITAETPFILGSLSKSFTAIAVVQLADEGKLALDAPVQQYLSWFTVRDRDAATKITIRQLLNHTSGLPKSAGLQLVRGAEASTGVEDARLVTNVRLHHAPGTTFEYSNANYWLLGLVIEAVTQGSYETYLRSHVLVPLAMEHTYIDERIAEVHGLATGHRIWFGYPRAETLPYYWREMSVGYLISTADDMGRYLLAHLNGGSDGGAPVISARGLAELHTPPAASPYAMGWLIDSVAGIPVLWHTGAVANYHGDMLIIPSSRWGVVLLSNVNNFILEGQLSDAVKGVAALLLGYAPPRQPWFRFRASYALILAAALLWLTWRVWQVVRLRHWAREQRVMGPRSHAWLPAYPLVDPGVALGLLAGVPILLGSPISTLRWFVPDLTDWMILNAVVAIAIAGVRIAFLKMASSSSPEAEPLRPM